MERRKSDYMDSDYMLIGIVLMGIVYLFGNTYHTLAFYGAGIIVFLWIVTAVQTKPVSSKSKSPYLDPIIIDSTRGAPYRIPDKMVLKYNPSDKAEKYFPAYLKATNDGLGALIGKSIGGMFGKLAPKPKEEEKK